MNETHPLQIYLDSSDYSDLTRDQFADELKFLTKLVDTGTIQVRYSNVTISELIHTEKKHQHYAIDRAKVLRALCRKRCLIYNDELLYRDCIRELVGQTSDFQFPNYAYDDKANWFPPRRGSLQSFKSELIKTVTNTIREEIKRHPNPAEKKLLKKRLKGFIRNGNFTSEGMNFIKNMDLDSAIIEKFTFLNKTKPSQMIRNHLLGKITHTELENYLFENGADPANLAEFTIDQIEDGLSKFQWLRKGGASFIDGVKELLSLVDKIESFDKEHGNARSRKDIVNDYGLDFSSLRQKMLEKCWADYKDDFRRHKLTYSKFKTRYEDAELGTLPSIDIAVEILPAYVEQLITKNRTKLLSSDFGDIAHAAYLPYVDIFRADRTMTHLFRNVADKYQTKVIRTLSDLVSELDKSVSNQ